MNFEGKYAFISHPYSRNPTQNIIKADKICKYWIKKGVIPISPLHLFSVYDNDNSRAEIMEFCYRLIDKVDVVFIYGNSKGCKLERTYAKRIKKPTYIFFDEKEHGEVNTIECYYLMRERGINL